MAPQGIVKLIQNLKTQGAKMNFRDKLSRMWNNIQYDLLPDLEDRTGALPDNYKDLVAILELIRIENFISEIFRIGRPSKDRKFIARAFIAKTVLKISYTKQLIQLLNKDSQLKIICGWDKFTKLPSEAKFSRAFKEFSDVNLPDKVHQALISEIYKDKLIGHLVKDSTPIHSRESFLKKKGTPTERKKKQNAQYRKEKKGLLSSRKQKQLKQNLDQMINELPTSCDIGAKQGTHGYRTIWKGYKLHAAVDDNCIPISAILTSASLNDSEVAIPLAEKSRLVAVNLYDLMDSAYDTPEIRAHSRALGHIPIIDTHARSASQKEEKALETKRKKNLGIKLAEDIRYKARFSKERFNAQFKDFYGGNNLYYKGGSKVFCHLMFGTLALTAATLLKFLQ